MSDRTAADVLDAAVAALPRDELIETFARAVAEGRDYWDDLDEHTRDEYREDVRVGFRAIGLIPEHITATAEWRITDPAMPGYGHYPRCQAPWGKPCACGPEHITATEER